jgi:PTH1 family peptidyl-tRNA hydrolase
MKLIVGLGNPGDAYRDTRHNIGFMLADKLAETFNGKFRLMKGEYEAAEISIKGEKVVVIKPLTYMNLSGKALKKALVAHKSSLQESLTCYDDLHLPIGALRLRPAGSAAGHNGVQNIIDLFGSTQFPRLRMGIGNDFPQGMQKEYVLTRFDSQERLVVDEMIERSIEGIVLFVRQGIDRAMNVVN